MAAMRVYAVFDSTEKYPGTITRQCFLQSASTHGWTHM